MTDYIKYVPDMEQYILTNWYYPDRKDKSGYAEGKSMRHDDWLKCEKESYARKGKRVEIVVNELGQLALLQVAQ